MTKVVKKKKIKWIPFFLFIILIAGVIFFMQIFLRTKVKNIIITGNDLVSDIEIMELAGLSDYPSFYFTTGFSIERRLKANPLIQSVKVKRKFYHVFEIEIKEADILYQKEEDSKYVLSNGKEITLDIGTTLTTPKLVNYVPNNKMNSFLKGLKKIDPTIREKISEMTYVPNDYDEDRFLLYLDDGNMVYLTLTKFSMLNYYKDVLPQLEGKKGILYLDSGNHFKIME